MSKLGDVVRAIRALFSPASTVGASPAPGAGLTGFPEAHGRPFDPRVSSQGAQPDWSLEQGWDRRYTVDRAQQLHRANLLAGSILERNAEHVVGAGFRSHGMTGDKVLNTESRLMWEEWTDSPFLCDVRARKTFWELEALRHVGTMRDGDAGHLMREDGRIRLVNSIEIASPTGGYYRTTEADGVERDKDGKHLAYWIFEPDEIPYPNVRTALHRLMRVPAKDVVFTARTPLGYQQTRGITAFLGTFQLLEQVDGTLMAIAVKAQMAAKFAMIITKKSPIPAVSIGGNRNPITKIDDGILTRLEADEDIKPVQSMDPNANMIDLTKLLIRFVGTRFGLALATITLDHSDHNFANAQASETETHACIVSQQLGAGRAASEIRNMKLIEWVRTGKLGARLRRRADQMPEDTYSRLLKHKWGFPCRPPVDRLKQAQADLIELDMGTIDWNMIAARRNLTARELFKRQAQQRAQRKELELPDVRSSLTRDSLEAAAELMPEADDSGDEGDKKTKQNGASSSRFSL